MLLVVFKINLEFKWNWMPRYIWNTAKVGVKHQLINQSNEMAVLIQIYKKYIPTHHITFHN